MDAEKLKKIAAAFGYGVDLNVQPLITEADVRRVFGEPVEPIEQPQSELCEHCGHRYSKKVQRTYLDGHSDFCCHACGRTWGKETLIQIKMSAPVRIHPLMKLVGKRGGVFCRSCYRPMQVSIVNGGYDWNCEPCGIVWRCRL